jgi:tRNA threonylcarbamoyladenosine biosynthesis protein TsaE
MGRVSTPGTVIALRGGLGAGKTAFCRGLARGLGVDVPVTSPTYMLINEYDGTLPFFHFDAYRLASAEDFRQLDADRYLFGNGVCAVEWSERVAEALPHNSVIVEIQAEADGSRSIWISGSPIEESLG